MSTEVSPASDLDAFVALAKSKGVSDETLVALLRQGGWSQRRVYWSLGAYYRDLLGVASPERGGGGADDARDAFLYLLNFITLGFWATALGSVFYTLIDRRFPGSAVPGAYVQPLRDALAWNLATILVTFPCFVVVAQLIGRELRRRPEAYGSRVRVWLTYVALVIAALIALTDGIWFLETFLRGSLTVRFVLDALVLLVISGGIFAYYLRSVRAAEPPH